MKFNESTDFDFRQAKQSELFIAKNDAKIEVGTAETETNIRVNFGRTNVVLLQPKDEEEIPNDWTANVGAGRDWSGQTWDELVDSHQFLKDLSEKENSVIINPIGDETISSAEIANQISDYLSLFIEKSELSQNDYDKVMNSLIVNRGNLYKIEYLRSDGVETTGYFLSNEMTSTRGGNALFKGSNTVTLGENSNIEVIYGDIVRLDGPDAELVIVEGAELKSIGGKILNIDNGAMATNHTRIKIYGKIEDGFVAGHAALGKNTTYINSATGELFFNIDPDNLNQFYKEASGDNVAGQGTQYINEGNIYSSNIATIQLSEGATFLNKENANLFIAAQPTLENDFSTGVRAFSSRGNQNATTIINNGNIYVGYSNLESDGTKGEITKVQQMKTSQEFSGYKITERSNAIASILDISAPERSLSINNEGLIQLSDSSVGINIETTETPENRVDALKKAVSIINTGDILALGNYSAGIKISGSLGNILEESSDPALANIIVNYGHITVEGEGSTGMQIQDGAVAYHSGGSIIVKDNVKDTSTINTNPSNNPNIKTVKRNYGITSQNGATVYLTQDAKIRLEGYGTVGARARLGGKIVLQGLENIEVVDNKTLEDVTLYWISGLNIGSGEASSIVFGTDNVNLELHDKLINSTLIRVDNGAKLSSKIGGEENDTEDSTVKNNDTEKSTINYNLTIKGEGSRGIDIEDKGTRVIIDKSFKFDVEGKNAMGIRVTSAAGTGKNTLKEEGLVELKEDTQISVKGEGATAALVDGTVYDDDGLSTGVNQETILISHANLYGTPQEGGGVIDAANGAFGYKLINKGKLSHQGQIDFEGIKDATAIYVEGGELDNADESKVVVGAEGAVGVDVYGKDSVVANLGYITATDGIAAVRLNKDASLTIKGNATSTEKSILGQGTADAVRVHNGAGLTLENAVLQVDGSGSGINFMNLNSEGSETSTFTLTGAANILVKGDKGAGITVQGDNEEIGNANFIATNADKIRVC